MFTGFFSSGASTLLGTPGIAASYKKLLGVPGLTTRNKKLLVTSASLLVTSALLVVTRTLLGAPGIATRSRRFSGPDAVAALAGQMFPVLGGDFTYVAW